MGAQLYQSTSNLAVKIMLNALMDQLKFGSVCWWAEDVNVLMDSIVSYFAFI